MLFSEVVARCRGAIAEAEAPATDEVFAVTVDTFEPGDAYPVVRHIFYGKTEKEARSYMDSHKKTDKFFSACFKGKMGDVKCRNSKVTVKKIKLSELK